MIEPDVRRYLVDGDPAAPVLTLRGHEVFIPRLLQVLGAVALVACAVGVYGVVTSPGDAIPLGLALAGGALGVGFHGYAWWRLRHPEAVVVVDRARQVLTIRRGNLAPRTIPFPELGPVSLGKMTTAVYYGHTGGRERFSHAVLGLSQHPGVVLYEPFTESDLARFVVTLRALVGEEHLPRAQPKPSPPAGAPS